MRIPRPTSNALISVCLMTAMATISSLRSFAYAGHLDERAAQSPVTPSLDADQLGVVNGSGHFTINGNEARSGVTVFNGSTVFSDWNARVSMELGPVGRAELGSETKVLVKAGGPAVHMDLDLCGSVTQSLPQGVAGRIDLVEPHKVWVKVTRGEVKVTNRDGDQVIPAGEDRTIDRVTSVAAEGDALFLVDCYGPRRGAILLWSGGLLALLGTAAGISVGLVKNDTPAKPKIPPQLSPSGFR